MCSKLKYFVISKHKWFDFIKRQDSFIVRLSSVEFGMDLSTLMSKFFQIFFTKKA